MFFVVNINTVVTVMVEISKTFKTVPLYIDRAGKMWIYITYDIMPYTKSMYIGDEIRVIKSFLI